jgi:hypothetical protein
LVGQLDPSPELEEAIDEWRDAHPENDEGDC